MKLILSFIIFQSPVLVKEFGAIDYLDFSPVEPYYFAATCSARIQVNFNFTFTNNVILKS